MKQSHSTRRTYGTAVHSRGGRSAAARRRARRREAMNRLLIVTAACALVLAVCLWGNRRSSAAPTASVVTSYASQTSVSAAQPAQSPTLDEDWVTVNLLPKSDYTRPGDALEDVKDIVVHYVANPGTTAAQNRSYFASLAQSHETSASSHFIVGLDGEVLQLIPLDEIAYGSNERNVDSIAIECCHPDESGQFNEETYRSLVRLLRTLCERYDLDEEHIIRHYDITGKLCPIYYVEHPDAWEQLKADVFDESFSVA